MTDFSPDQVTFGDLAGYGSWDCGHAREHLAFVQALAAQTPPVLIPDYNLLSFLASGEGRQSMTQSHYDAHKMLRQQAGITGTDLSAVDFDNESGFYSWLSYHAEEHNQIRQALGLS